MNDSRSSINQSVGVNIVDAERDIPWKHILGEDTNGATYAPGPSSVSLEADTEKATFPQTDDSPLGLGFGSDDGPLSQGPSTLRRSTNSYSSSGRYTPEGRDPQERQKGTSQSDAIIQFPLPLPPAEEVADEMENDEEEEQPPVKRPKFVNLLRSTIVAKSLAKYHGDYHDENLNRVKKFYNETSSSNLNQFHQIVKSSSYCYYVNENVGFNPQSSSTFFEAFHRRVRPKFFEPGDKMVRECNKMLDDEDRNLISQMSDEDEDENLDSYIDYENCYSRG